MAWLPTFALRILDDRVNNNSQYTHRYVWVNSPFDRSKLEVWSPNPAVPEIVWPDPTRAAQLNLEPEPEVFFSFLFSQRIANLKNKKNKK